MDGSNLFKKKYIEAFVDKIYENEKINYLFPEPISSFKQYALDMFLDTSLTEEEVAENMTTLILQRKKIYEEKMLREKREQDIRNAVLNIYSENPGLFDVSLEEMQKSYVDLYLDNTSVTMEDIENGLKQTVSELKERKNLVVKEEVQPIVMEYKPENISFEEKPVVNDEISTMLEEPTNDKVEIVTDNKEVTKVKKPNEKQAGSISLFSIGVSILAVTAFILMAMILNVLLK
jgi:hypothetical protein